MRAAAGSLVLLALAGGGEMPAAAQAPAGIVTTVRGEPTVTRSGLPRPLPLRARDDVSGRDRIETREDALARLLLGQGARDHP